MLSQWCLKDLIHYHKPNKSSYELLLFDTVLPGSGSCFAPLCWQFGARCYQTVGADFWHCWPPPEPLVAQVAARSQHQGQTSVNQKDSLILLTSMEKWPNTQCQTCLMNKKSDYWIKIKIPHTAFQNDTIINSEWGFGCFSWVCVCARLHLGQFWFEFSSSHPHAFGLWEAQVTRTPSSLLRLELLIRLKVNWGQSLWGWVLTESVGVGSVGEVTSRNLLFSVCHLACSESTITCFTALTARVLAMMDKIRPLSNAKYRGVNVPEIFVV